MRSRWIEATTVAALTLALGVAPALAGGATKAGKTDQPGAGAGAPSAAAGPFTGRHTMSGEVTRVDETKGTMTLKTAEGTLDLHFPPSALQHVKKGDHVSVELALRPEGAGARSRRDSGGSASPATGSDAGKTGEKKY
jgi:hypothetical protein